MAVAIQTTVGKTISGARPWRWSVEQYYKAGAVGLFEGGRVELLDGEIIEMPPIGDDHVASSIGAPHALLKAFGDGFEVSVQNPLKIPPTSAPEPDIVVIRGSWRLSGGVTAEQAVLVVEISDSTLHDDLTKKAMLYARADIPEYWVIDLLKRELVTHRQPIRSEANSYYAQVQRLKKGEKIAPLHAPDSLVAVSDLML